MDGRPIGLIALFTQDWKFWALFWRTTDLISLMRMQGKCLGVL